MKQRGFVRCSRCSLRQASLVSIIHLVENLTYCWSFTPATPCSSHACTLADVSRHWHGATLGCWALGEVVTLETKSTLEKISYFHCDRNKMLLPGRFGWAISPALQGLSNPFGDWKEIIFLSWGNRTQKTSCAPVCLFWCLNTFESSALSAKLVMDHIVFPFYYCTASFGPHINIIRAIWHQNLCWFKLMQLLWSQRACASLYLLKIWFMVWEIRGRGWGGKGPSHSL